MPRKLFTTLVGIATFAAAVTAFSANMAKKGGTLAALNELKKSVNRKAPTSHDIADFHGGTGRSSDQQALKTMCFVDEQDFESIQTQILVPWMNSWKNRDANALKALMRPSSQLPTMAYTLVSADLFKDQISEYQWKVKDGNVATGQWLSDAKAYLEGFSKVEDFELTALQVSSPREMRNKDMRMSMAELRLHFDIRGFEKSTRRQDKGLWTVIVEKHEGVWKITSAKPIQMETYKSKQPTFKPVTAQLGLDKVPSHVRLEAIRRGGYAVATSDFDGDGVKDLYVGSYGRGTLLKGSKDGGFTEVKSSGIEGDTFVKTATFADFNNDGFDDLLLVRFVPEKGSHWRTDHRNDIVIYKNLNGKNFAKVEQTKVPDTLTDAAMPAAVADFNNDGLLDFYVGFPGKKDFTTLAPTYGTQNQMIQSVYMNQGDFKFTTKILEKIMPENDKQLTKRQKSFPHGATPADIDMDGDVDIIVMDDRGQLSPVFINDGKGNFTQSAPRYGIENDGLGMGAAVGDLNGDGKPEVLMTNVNFTAADRLVSSCRNNWNVALERTFVFQRGLRIFEPNQGYRFSDVTDNFGLSWTGEGMAGVELIDYNGDGHLDIYAANGLWSGTDRASDLSSLFTRAAAQYATNEFVLLETAERTQSAFMDLLGHFRGDVIRGQTGIQRPHMAGFQRHRLYRNNGNGTFSEVGFLEGADEIADGYVMANVDYDNDGDLDLVLRNGDPGTAEVNYPTLTVYENQSTAKSVYLTFKGRRSNANGIGVLVTAKIGDKTLTRQVMGNNGAAQSERAVFIGLGQASKIDKLTVNWPSGTQQVFSNFKPGRYEIPEDGNHLRAAR